MSAHYDVIVVGLGAMGAAACDRLSQRGARVLGVDRFDLPNMLGSSAGQTRLIRRAYFEHPDYVPLLRHAYAGWDDLSQRSGLELLQRTGCLYLGSPGGDLITGSLRSAKEHALECDLVPPQEIAARFPAFRAPDSLAALWEADAGFVLCERALACLQEQALRRGADLRGRTRVLSWSADARSVRVETSSGVFAATRLILAAGAWTAPLLGRSDVELRVTRQVQFWLWPRQPATFELGSFPCWALEEDSGQRLYYGFPLLPSGRFAGPFGLKIGCHALGAEVEADSMDRDVTVADEAVWRPAIRRFLPLADGPVVAAKVCLYTSTADGHFVVDRHPEHDNVSLVCGFSGHGFKFAPVIGEALADLALDGGTSLPIGFLGLGRFGER